MWWAGSKPIDIYLGTRAVAVCEGAQLSLYRSVEGVDQALAFLDAWASGQAHGGKVALWLGGSLCRPFMMPPLSGVRGPAERRRAVAAMARELTGIDAECHVWIARGPAEKSQVAGALDWRIQSQLEATFGKRWKIASLRPWWAEMLRMALENEPRPSAVGVQDCDSLTILAGRGAEFESAITFTSVVDRETARAVFTRSLLSSSIEAEEAVLGALLAGVPAAAPLASVALGVLAEIVG